MDTRLQNSLLPLAAGAVLAVPVFFLTRSNDTDASKPAPAHPEIQATCGPFVESFTAMRAEAERIAGLATSTAAPVDGAMDMGTTAVTWRDIAAAARALDSWVWEASDPNAPLTLRETTTVAGVAPISSELRWDAADVASQLAAGVGDADPSILIRRMEAIAGAAANIARALDPLTACEAPVVTYAPQNDCDTRDPEYQAAMMGPCRY